MLCHKQAVAVKAALGLGDGGEQMAAALGTNERNPDRQIGVRLNLISPSLEISKHVWSL